MVALTTTHEMEKYYKKNFVSNKHRGPFNT